MARQYRTDDSSPWPDRFGNGSGGALTISSNTTEAPTDASCSGTSGTTTLSATNGSFAANQLILIHQTRGTGAGAWELNKISSYTAGTITTAYSLQNTYINSGASLAQVRVLPQYSSVTINGSVTYTAKAWDGNVGGILAFVCNGLTTVTGTITSSNKGFRNGTGGNATGAQGEGESGAGIASTSANGIGGGGGDSPSSTNPGAGGAGGGLSTAGAVGLAGSGNGTPGSASNTAGNAGLTVALFGGGGGAGGAAYGGGGPAGQAGGIGGGWIFIISKSVTVTGAVTNGGQNGTSSSDNSGAGGAGGGGSILIKGQVITLGSSLITATGGTGGTGTGGNNGGAGGVGRIHVDYSSTISGTTNPTLDSSQDSIFTDRGGGAFFGLM